VVKTKDFNATLKQLTDGLGCLGDNEVLYSVHLMPLLFILFCST